MVSRGSNVLCSMPVASQELRMLKVGMTNGRCDTTGLVAGILLLGYGMVAIPRQLWQHSNPESCHRWALYRSNPHPTFLTTISRP